MGRLAQSLVIYDIVLGNDDTGWRLCSYTGLLVFMPEVISIHTMFSCTENPEKNMHVFCSFVFLLTNRSVFLRWCESVVFECCSVSLARSSRGETTHLQYRTIWNSIAKCNAHRSWCVCVCFNICLLRVVLIWSDSELRNAARVWWCALADEDS